VADDRGKVGIDMLLLEEVVADSLIAVLTALNDVDFLARSLDVINGGEGKLAARGRGPAGGRLHEEDVNGHGS